MKRALGSAWERARPWLPDWWDLHVYTGIGLVAAGAWMVWPPAGLIVLGASLCGLGLLFLDRAKE